MRMRKIFFGQICSLSTYTKYYTKKYPKCPKMEEFINIFFGQRCSLFTDTKYTKNTPKKGGIYKHL